MAFQTLSRHVSKMDKWHRAGIIINGKAFSGTNISLGQIWKQSIVEALRNGKNISNSEFN